MPCGRAKMSEDRGEDRVTVAPAVSASQHCHLEHNYAKPSREQPEPMDTSEVVLPGSDQADVKNSGLFELDDDNDTFETFLLGLLRCHTTGQTRPEAVDSELVVDISPEALDTLSQEQLHALVTSNSVNYDVVQQILAQKHLKQPQSVATQQPKCDDSHISTLSNISSTSRVEQPVASLPTTVTTATTSTATTSAPTISIQLTPNQLKVLQSQVMELLRQQQSMPSNLTLPQQQAVIQSLITQRLNSSLQQLLSSTTPTPSTSTTPTVSTPTVTNPTVTTSTPSVTTPTPTATTSTIITPTPPSPTPLPALPTPLPVIPIPTSTRMGGNKNDVQSISTPTTTTSASVATTSAEVTASASSKKGKEVSPGSGAVAGRKRKDSESKRLPTPFNIFFSDVYPSLLEEHDNLTFAEVSKIVSSKWAKLGPEGKQKYHEKYEQLKMESKQKSDLPSPMEVDQSKELAGPSHTSNTTKKAESKPSRGKSKKKEEGLCVAEKCFNVAVYTQERGHQFCSNECVVKHCRHFFLEWVAQRKLRT